MNMLVARQPVFTADKKIFGYELLFRDSLENTFPEIDGDTATSTLLSNAFFSFGIADITGNKPALINFTKELLLQGTPQIFPKEHIIVEILENIEPDEEVIEAIRQLKEKGFRIALDDFVFNPKFIPMMKLASIIKFDIMETPLDTIETLVENLQSTSQITLLSEKVETYEEFEQSKKMGFELFQGYFFAKPKVLSQKEVSSNQITKFNIINETGKTELDLAKIESLIKKDVSVSYKILKFINSAYFKRATAINTIKDAITYLGTDELKKFLKVVAVSELGENKPNELVRLSLIRAKMCELCGSIFTTKFSTDELFTIGLFSNMDAMLDREMNFILDAIKLSDHIKTAILGKNVIFNKILKIVKCFETADWQSQIFNLIDESHIAERLSSFYHDSIVMADSYFQTAKP